MQYTLNTSNYHTFPVFEVNKLPPRSYFMEKPFELGVKPYTDRALLGMSHRGDEVRIGTFVTVQAFQQGIGTGACGPAIAPEFLYDARRDYRLRFLIRVAPTCQLE